MCVWGGGGGEGGGPMAAARERIALIPSFHNQEGGWGTKVGVRVGG
jgi:hypothetical protein